MSQARSEISGIRSERTENEPLHRPAFGAVIVLGLAAVLAVGLVHVPRENAALPAIARYAVLIALPKWHTTEPVNEVVYGTRGFDTFGETFILLGAVVCVAAICRRREPRKGFIGEEEAGSCEQSEDDPKSDAGDRDARRAERAEGGDDDRTDRPTGPLTPDDEPLGIPGPEMAQGMTVVVRVASRVTAPVLAIAGIYLAAWGYSPGGGFPAGAVLAGVVLLVYAAFGYGFVLRAVRPTIIETLELAGALLIIVIEAMGLVLKGSFSASWLPLAKPETIPGGGILQAFSGAELIEVATGLTLVIFAFLGMEHDWTDDENGGESQ